MTVFSTSDTNAPVNLTTDSSGVLFASDDAGDIVSFSAIGEVETQTPTSGAYYITAAVPEPSVWALLGLGGLAAAWYRGRRRS